MTSTAVRPALLIHTFANLTINVNTALICEPGCFIRIKFRKHGPFLSAVSSTTLLNVRYTRDAFLFREMCIVGKERFWRTFIRRNWKWEGATPRRERKFLIRCLRTARGNPRGRFKSNEKTWGMFARARARAATLDFCAHSKRKPAEMCKIRRLGFKPEESDRT